MKLNLEKTGLDMIFKEYERIIITELFKGTESTVFEDGKCGSGKAWEYCCLELSKRDHGTISRASVIFFLNRMVDEGLLEFIERTGKGGHHRVYHSKVTLAQFWQHVMKRVYLKLIEASGDTDFMKKLSETEGDIDIY